MNPLRAYSSKQSVGSWGWRHARAWQQLSALWGLHVQQNYSDHLPGLPAPACAYTLAVAPGEFVNLDKLENYFNTAPVILFLNRVSLHVHEHVNVKIEEDLTPPGSFQHVFQIDMESPLTTGLPGRLVTYGPLTDITPLPVEAELQVLVWLDKMPIIGYRSPHLFIGADAWQLGNPSVPMVYPILLNWLRSAAGCDLRIVEPCAAVRLDDLPITANELLHYQPTPDIDRRRAVMLRRLRNYSLHSGVCLSFMYTSHYYSADGNLLPVGSAMPLSIRELRLGVEQGVFEIGAHGMLHLRYDRTAALEDADPREFLDLDEEATNAHLGACIGEIRRLFDVHPESFVAPAWGYRPVLTKKIAGQQFKAIIDSSQHMEDGSVRVFSIPDEEYPAFNCTETFRPGSRMLSFTSPGFWKCYAIAGIPIHYMQHIDTNWHLLQSFLDIQLRTPALPSGDQGNAFVDYMQNARKPRLVRATVAIWLLLTCLLRKPTLLEYIVKLLTASSLYVIINSMQTAGYRCIGITELVEFIPKTRKK